MGKYGTNLEGFGAFEGGVNSDKGAPLVSTSSDGETALLFGPAALREIQAGVANGDFAIPPDAAGDTITDENPLPYWTFTDTDSAGAITCAVAIGASGSSIVWTVAANTGTGKTATLSRYIPVPSSRDRAYAFWPEFFVEGATNSTNRQIIFTLQFYTSDFIASGTAITRTYPFSDFTSAAAAVFLNSDSAGRLVVPADAQLARISIQVDTIGTNASVSTVKLVEVKMLTAYPMLLVAERSSATDGPAAIWKQNGTLYIAEEIPTTWTAGALSTTNATIAISGSVINITSAAQVQGNLTVANSGNLVVQGDTSLEGANSNWLARITNTATQSLVNNTATKLLFNTASATPTSGSYDPKGWFNNANDSIDIGQDGFYCVTANVAFATNATGRREVTILVNGTSIGSVNVSAASASTTNLSVSTNLYLFSSDQVTVNALQTSGGALNTANVTGVFPALSVGRIGA